MAVSKMNNGARDVRIVCADIIRNSEVCGTCVVYTGPLDSSGRVAIKGVKYRPANIVWENCYGKITGGEHLNRKCDTVGCIHPEHLYLGSKVRELKDIIGWLVIQPNGCCVWPYSHNPNGYGMVWSRDINHLVHKLVYEAAVERVPDGLHLHHTCDNKLCANWAHLEVLTPKEHSALTPNANRNKSICKRGHLFDEANTYTSKEGKRRCRICAKEDQQRRRAEQSL